jgi:hypothetical protein
MGVSRGRGRLATAVAQIIQVSGLEWGLISVVAVRRA